MARDPGLQAERTALAWSRTGLTVLVNALLVLRSGWTSGSVSISALAIVLLAAAGAITLCGVLRRRQLLSGCGLVAASARLVAGATVVALMACAAAALSVLAG